MQSHQRGHACRKVTQTSRKRRKANTAGSAVEQEVQNAVPPTEPALINAEKVVAGYFEGRPTVRLARLSEDVIQITVIGVAVTTIRQYFEAIQDYLKRMFPTYVRLEIAPQPA